MFTKKREMMKKLLVVVLSTLFFNAFSSQQTPLQIARIDFQRSNINDPCSPINFIRVFAVGGSGGYTYSDGTVVNTTGQFAGPFDGNPVTFVVTDSAGTQVQTTVTTGANKTFSFTLLKSPIVNVFVITMQGDVGVSPDFCESEIKDNGTTILDNGPAPEVTRVFSVAPGAHKLEFGFPCDPGLADSMKEYQLRNCPLVFNPFSIVDIIVQSPVQLSLVGPTTRNPACFGQNGIITFAVNGGIPPYTACITTSSPPNCTVLVPGIQQGVPVNQSIAVGTYRVAVTDSVTQTITSAPVTIVSPSQLVASIISTTPDQCTVGVKGTIVAGASGATPPYEFSLDGGATFQPTGTFTNIEAGSYTVIVRDSNGCTTSIPVAVSLSDLSFTFTTISQCSELGGKGSITVEVSGGQVPYVVTVDGQPTQELSQDTFLAADLEAGSYQVNTTDDLGCVRISTGEVPLSDLDFTFTTISQCLELGGKGSITVEVSGGQVPYVVTVDGEATQELSQDTFLAADLDAGSYQVATSDGRGCIRIGTVQVPLSDLDFSSTVTPQCKDMGLKGTITITVSGGEPPYAVTVDGQSAQELSPTTFMVSGLDAGSYQVATSDGRGCTRTGTVKVPLSDLDFTTEIVPQSFEDGVGGSITITVLGGKAPFEVTVNGNETQQVSQNVFRASDLEAGRYDVFVEDSFGCTTSGEEVVLSDNAILNFILLKYC